MGNKYSNYLALDADGVFSDTFTGRLRRRGLIAPDTRVMDFIESNPQIFEQELLGKFDVQGTLAEAVKLLAYYAKMSDTGFIFVSSWIYKSQSFEAVNELFRKVSGVVWDKPFIAGQISAVGTREDSYLHWIKNNVDVSYKPGIGAIDDSGEKHFPFLSSLGLCITPCGRQGFTVNDYIKMCRTFDAKCPEWGGWKHQEDSIAPENKLTHDEFLHIIKTHEVEDMAQASRILLRMK